ncbi:MAG TPA: PKD domain-containing protein, partial [Propionibacteriaceae bacterium]|nr:PKD domain-containing protein [Propionibacteriaceae bacterium]
MQNLQATSDSGGTLDSTVTVNWGDGSALETYSADWTSSNPNAGVTPSHTYTEPSGRNGYPIALWTNETNPDNSTDQGCSILSATVSEATPITSLSGDSSIQEGSTYTITPYLSDPGGDTPTQWQMNWGDGTSIETDSPESSYAHVFNTTGNLTITATATTEDGQYSATLPINVQGQPPSDPSNFVATVSGGRVDLSWTASTGFVTAYHAERSTDGSNYADLGTTRQP